MPIYYSEEVQGWKFDQVTEKERELISELGERHFIHDMVYSLVKQRMAQELEFDDNEEFLEHLDKEQMPSA
jgi:hypothetical protein